MRAGMARARGTISADACVTLTTAGPVKNKTAQAQRRQRPGTHSSSPTTPVPRHRTSFFASFRNGVRISGARSASEVACDLKLASARRGRSRPPARGVQWLKPRRTVIPIRRLLSASKTAGQKGGTWATTLGPDPYPGEPSQGGPGRRTPLTPAASRGPWSQQEVTSDWMTASPEDVDVM
jgi:hypothetical protein